MWRTTVSSWRNSLFDRFSIFRLGFLRFSHGGLVATFSSSSGLPPLYQSLLVVPTLRSDFVNLQKLVVTFCLLLLLLLCTWPCYNLHRLISLLSLFVLSTLRSDLYCILFYTTNCVCRRYDRISLLIILLEDSFDRSCSSTNLSAAAYFPCVATVHCPAIATGLL